MVIVIVMSPGIPGKLPEKVLSLSIVKEKSSPVVLAVTIAVSRI